MLSHLFVRRNQLEYKNLKFHTHIHVCIKKTKHPDAMYSVFPNHLKFLFCHATNTINRHHYSPSSVLTPHCIEVHVPSQ